MQFKVKLFDLEAGDKPIVILHKKNSDDLNVKAMDRVIISKNSKTGVGIVDITTTLVKEYELGVFASLKDQLDLKEGEVIELTPTKPPVSVEYIKKKMFGQQLRYEELNEIVCDIVKNKLSEIEIACFIVSVTVHNLTIEEIGNLANSMSKNGVSLQINKSPVVDKHSIGGIPGNRISPILVPIVASQNIIFPKTSSRAITSPAGTADAMEVLCDVDFDIYEIDQLIKKIGCCIVSGEKTEIAPADDKMIRVRYPLGIDPEPLMIASILAKKKAVNANYVLIDIPTGKGAKVTHVRDAEKLANKFMTVGNNLNLNIGCIITPGDKPIGKRFGPALEAKDVLMVLEQKRNSSKDLIRKSVVLAGIIFEKFRKAKPGKGRELATRILRKGLALKKFKEIIEAQGGDPNITSSDIELGPKSYTVKAKEAGRVFAINNEIIRQLARLAGAPYDKGAGIELLVNKGDRIKIGMPILKIYAHSERKLTSAINLLETEELFELERVILKQIPERSIYL